MIKEKLLEYSFFQFLLKIKLEVKRILRKTRLYEMIYDKKSFSDFKKMIGNPEFIYEKEIEFLPKFIANGSNVFDIGANRGEYSYHFAKLVGDNGIVLAFEPGKRAFLLLERIKKYYSLDNLRLFNLAMKDKKGTDTLIVPYHNRQSQLNSMNPIKGRKESVSVTSLDDIAIDMHLDHIDFIKCDTEGSEYLVFTGALNSVKKYKPVILAEITDVHSTRFGYTSNNILTFFADIDYEPYYYNYSDKNLIKKTKIDINADTLVWSKKSEDLSNNNYFFIHKSRVPEFNDYIAS